MERTRVIIADDESLIRMDLREMLTNLGYLVVGEAGDGRSTVNLARELRPDIVIMDIKMPDMDGIEVTTRIRKPKHINQSTPIIAISAHVIGYEKGAAIAKKAYQENRPVLEVAQEMTDLDEATLKRLLDPHLLTQAVKQ